MQRISSLSCECGCSLSHNDHLAMSNWEEEASNDGGHHTFLSRTGLDLDADAHDDGRMMEEDFVPRHTPFLTDRRRQRRPKKMMHIDTTDPRLDMALHYVSRGPLADLAQERASIDPLTARRRGRAIYLNDLLQFSAKEQATHFYSALVQWREAQDEEEGELGEEEDEQDMIVLLAQARSLAQSSTSTLSPRHGSHRWRFNEKANQKRAMADLRTSASTPEGVLGRIPSSPSREINFNTINWDEEEKQEVLNSSDEEDAESSLEDEQANEVAVLRAGLRFMIGCYDDLIKKSKSDASVCNHHNYRQGSTEESPSGPAPVRTRSRSHSLIKSLAMKGASLTSDRSNRYSSSSSIGQESVLDVDTASLNQIAGPSSRYGMASVSALVSPATEEKNPMDKTSPLLFKTKSLRRSSDASLLSSPVWSRRPSKLETPSEQDEPCTEQVSVSHSSLVSALQQMRRMDREKIQRNSLSPPSSDSHADGALREERVKTAALARELETLKASLSHQERQSNEAAGLSDIERGARSEEEAMMMQAVAQAARDTVEAEEREAEWKVECEVITERVNVLEEALFQAMGLLAGKEHETQSSDNGFMPSPAFAAKSTRDADGRASGASSPFYSATEEDDVEDETPYASLSRTNGSDFAATLEHYSKTGSDAQPFSPSYEQAGETERRNRIESRNDSTVKVAGWEQGDTILNSDSDTSFDRRARDSSVVAESVLASPRSSTSGPAISRRDSHASWVRHSILPPRPPRPTSPLPTLPSSSDKGEPMKKSSAVPVPAIAVEEGASFDSAEPSLEASSAKRESPLETKRPSLSTGIIIDYSKRARANRSSIAESESIEEMTSSPPTFGHVDLYSNLRSAIAEEKKAAPITPVVSIQTEQSGDETSSSDLEPEPLSPSITRSSSLKTNARAPSFTDTIRSRDSISHSSSSNSTRDKHSKSKKATSKLSIIGHMPPTYHADEYNRGSISSASLLSIDTQPSSVSTGISEHYERLAAPKMAPANPAFFARRTRFTAS